MPAERTPPADDSLLSTPLLALTEWSLRAPLTVLVAACGLAVLAVAIAASGLTFKSSRLDLLNPRSEYNQRWLAYLAEFGDRDDACVVVRAERQADLTAAIDEVGRRLSEESRLFDSVFFRRDLTRLKSKALHYLPPEQLAQIDQQLAAAAAVLPRAGESADPVERLALLNEELAHGGAATPAQRARMEEQYLRTASTLLAALGGNTGPTTGAGQLAENANVPALQAFDPQYLLADGGKLGFVLTRLNQQAGEAAANSTAIARLRAIVRDVQDRQRHVWIGLTGMPVIEHDEMAASQVDMLWTSVVSMGLVLLLYLAAYGGVRHAILVNVLLLLGTAYSFGFVTLAVGHLNILSAAFSAVLIGLGIDFAIHYVATYLNLRRQGFDEQESLLRMAVEVGPGVVTGGVTTAAAFFMAAMTDFVGVRELGLVAGGGILLCVLATVTVLPPLIMLVDRRWPMRRLPAILPAARWFQFPIRWPRLTMAGALAGAAIVTAGSVNLRYDHNLLNLQPRHLESADIERQLLTRLDDSVWFAVSVCATPAELRERKQAFERLPQVSKTEEIASLFPVQSPEQAAIIRSIDQRLAALPESSPTPPRVDAVRLEQEIVKAQDFLVRATPYETAATASLAQVRAALAALAPQDAARRISEGVATNIRRLSGQVEPLRQVADSTPPRMEDLPRDLTDRYVGKHGTHLLKVFAHGNIWNMDQLRAFVQAVETVDPRVTGHPVQTYYASRHMQSSYVWAGVYALGAVLVLLWIDFRSLPHSLLAMVPPAIGFAMMCGCLGWLDIPFNPANMIVLPLILGIGVDHGVHLVHVWRQQHGRFVLGDATAVAVLLTASTTTASFGALILARHQGLQSLGQAITLGVTTCLVASIVFFPALLAWLSGNRAVNAIAADPAVALNVREDEESAVGSGESIAVGATTSDSGPVEVVSAPTVVQEAAAPVLAVAAVTDEEIAALLESAFTTRLPATTITEQPPRVDDANSAILRRRKLPRRTEAA